MNKLCTYQLSDYDTDRAPFAPGRAAELHYGASNSGNNEAAKTNNWNALQCASEQDRIDRYYQEGEKGR